MTMPSARGGSARGDAHAGRPAWLRGGGLPPHARQDALGRDSSVLGASHALRCAEAAEQSKRRTQAGQSLPSQRLALRRRIGTGIDETIRPVQSIGYESEPDPPLLT